MEEIIVSKDELIDMFAKELIKDSNVGWLYEDSMIINIIAIHDKDPKYVYDVTNADYYKIVPVKNL